MKKKHFRPTEANISFYENPNDLSLEYVDNFIILHTNVSFKNKNDVNIPLFLLEFNSEMSPHPFPWLFQSPFLKIELYRNYTEKELNLSIIWNLYYLQDSSHLGRFFLSVFYCVVLMFYEDVDICLIKLDSNELMPKYCRVNWKHILDWFRLF